MVNTWKVILATMLIFGTGVVTGGLLVQHSFHSRPARAQQRAAMGQRLVPASSPAAWSRMELLRRTQRDLDLTPEQRQSIERILKEGQERMKKLAESIEPRRRQELHRTLQEFREALTPEQRVRFDQLLKQQQRARKAAPVRQQSAPGLPASNSVPASNI